MYTRVLNRFKPLLLILGWAISTAALTLSTIFQGQLIPKNINGGGLYSQVLNASPVWLWIFYLGNFAICVLVSMVVSDAGRAMVYFFPSFISAGIITFFVLALPDFVGIVFDPSGIIQGSAVVFTFTAFFPLLLLVNLAGTVAGIAVGERFL